MPNDESRRLREDLSTIRQALKLDETYDAGDVPTLLVLALGAAIAIPLLEFTALNQRLCLLLALAPGFVMYARRYAAVRRAQAERPTLWSEYRLSLVLGVCVAPLALAWIWWSQRHFGTTREVAGAPIVFCMGVVASGVGLLDANRRGYLIVGVPSMLFGMALPLLEPHRIATVGAGLLAVTCLMFAAFIWSRTGPTAAAATDMGR